MDDGTVNYIFSITKVGSGAQQTVQEFQQVRDGAQAAGQAAAGLSKDATETGNSFENLAGKAFYVRGGIDAIRAAAMDGGTRAGFYAIDETIRGMIASGLAMGTILPVLGGLALAVGGGLLVWKEYKSELEDIGAEATALNDKFKSVANVISMVSDAGKSGLLSSSGMNYLTELATGNVTDKKSIPIFNAIMQGQMAPEKGMQMAGLDTSKLAGMDLPQKQSYAMGMNLAGLGDWDKEVSVPMTPEEQAAEVMTYLERNGFVVEQKNKDGGKSYEPSEIGKALIQTADLQAKFSDPLKGTVAELQKKQEEFLSELKQLQALASAKEGTPTSAQNLLTQKTGVLQTTASQNFSQAFSNDDAKAAAEAAKEQAESENKIREAAARDAADMIKALESSITLFQAQQGAVRSSTVETEYQMRIGLAESLYVFGKINEQQYTEMVQAAQTKEKEGEDKVMASKVETLKEFTDAENELAVLQDKINASNLTGEARKQAAIKATTDAMVAQIQKVGAAAGLTQQEIDKMVAAAKTGEQTQQQAAQNSAMGIMTTDQMMQAGTKSFASGMADALVSFADGTKTAQQAFEQFAASFLEEIAKMIMQQAILNALGSSGSATTPGTGVLGFIAGMLGGGGGTATANSAGDVPDVSSFAAAGGFFPAARMAADGIQSVSSPTYFPKFNVVAGEAGMEMLTVLAHPTFRNVGGMDAVVGNAGNRRLAITNESDLENAGGSGAGGMIHIRIEHTPETQATIIQNSIKGAVTEVTHQMKRNSPLALATKQLTQ